MAYNTNNYQNSDTKKKNSYTQGITLYNSTDAAPEKSALKLGFTNNYMSLGLAPMLPADKQTSEGKFDHDSTVGTLLSIEKLTILIEGLINKVEPAMKGNETASVGVPVGGNNLVVMGHMQDKGIFVALFKELDESTRVPKQKIVYWCNRGLRVDDFAPESGSFTSVETDNEYIVIKNFFVHAANSLCMGTAHAQRYVDRFWRSKLTPESNNSGYKNSYNKSNMWGSNSGSTNNSDSNSGSNYSAETSPIENAEDIAAFMPF